MFSPSITAKESTRRFIAKIREVNPKIKVTLLKQAYQYAWNAHKDQLRRSGEPFLAHPVAVAIILAEQKLDHITIAAGLLHDVLEDTDATIDTLRETFSDEIARLVDGVTKIDTFQASSRQQRQVETYRKMLLSMARDLRVIIIKFADRLHNLRTLKFLAPEKIKAIATETLDIYAPLAHRLGMARIKWELEDLAFKHLHPNEYNGIVSRVVRDRHEREKIIDTFAIPLRNTLDNEGVKAVVVGRPKHFFSIYRKMSQRNKPFKEIYDLLALRVITDSISDCYHTLGVIHSMWKPIQYRFKDYISTPKTNGYQSLHTTVVGQGGHIIEMQIRTWQMNQTAEDGIAAHWLYKDGKMTHPSKDDNALTWLKNIIEWQKELTDSTEFFEFFKVDLFHAEIFLFTPKGDLITLPKGATVLDFAFSVHTDLGLHCVGARVDGKIETISKELVSGSTVEILHLESKKPSIDWLKDAKTSKARSAIKRWLTITGRQESIDLGKEIVQAQIKKLHLSISLKEHLPQMLEYFNRKTEDGFYEQVGRGAISVNRILAYFSSRRVKKPVGSQLSRFVDSLTGRSKKLHIGKDDTMMIRYAPCCNPVPGDEIIGFMTKGRGISVHRKDCSYSLMFDKDDERAIEITWEGNKQETRKYFVNLELTATNRKGLLRDLSLSLDNCEAEVVNCTLNVNNQLVNGSLKLEIANSRQLKEIVRSLEKIKNIEKVFRTRDKEQLVE